MFIELAVILAPIINRSNNWFCLFYAFSHFRIFQLNQSFFLFPLRVPVSETSLKTIVSSIRIMLVQRRLILGQNSLQHSLIRKLDIELTQMRQMMISSWLNVMVIDRRTKSQWHFGIKFTLGFNYVMVV